MKLLAVDATEDACSAALLVDGAVGERFEIAPRRHSELLLPMLDGLLADAGLVLAQLDGLAFARGPGAFTGIRIATSVAQGAAFAADLPVVPVSSLHALAHGVHREHAASAVLSGLDARMGEVYWGAFRVDDRGRLQPVGAEVVCPAGAVPVPDLAGSGDGWIGAGSAWAVYPQELVQAAGRPSAVHATWRVHALDVALLGARLLEAGAAVAAEDAAPVYLRNDVAWARS